MIKKLIPIYIALAMIQCSAPMSTSQPSVIRSATILLTGENLETWRVNDGTWFVSGGVELAESESKNLTSFEGTGVLVNNLDSPTQNIVSRGEFSDIKAHIEFLVPKGSNSGVYVMGRYEIQILDSYGKEEVDYSDCGGIYQRWDEARDPKGFEGHGPRVNASLQPGEWQSFDFVFRAPRFDDNGNKVMNAIFESVHHNGILIHENVEVMGPTRSGTYEDEQARGPIMLQGDHGPVAYRNIQITPLASE